MIKSIKGTRDVFSPEVEKWQFVERKAQEICAIYGYREIRTPVFESTELFSRSIGEVTDIVTKQMFTFRAREESMTLRPEGTAPVVRSYVEQGWDRDPSIRKLYYLGPMFRHERPQKGRYWQFSQFGIEVLGTVHPAIDAEVIEVLLRFLDSCGAKEHELQLNSVGCRVCRPRYTQALQDLLRRQSGQMCADCQVRIEKNPLRVLDCKVEADQPIINALPSIDKFLDDDCGEHFEQVRKFLGLSGIQYTRNHRMVRGLDYYTKTTFEVILPGLGSQNSVAGGGRYDGLVEDLGGKPTQAIGFALGLDRLVLALPEEPAQRTGLAGWIMATDETAFDFAYENVLLPLRREGIACDLDYQRRSLKASMRYADKMNMAWVIIVGDEEVRQNKFTLKDMKTGSQDTYTLDEIMEKLK